MGFLLAALLQVASAQEDNIAEEPEVVADVEPRWKKLQEKEKVVDDDPGLVGVRKRGKLYDIERKYMAREDQHWREGRKFFNLGAGPVTPHPDVLVAMTKPILNDMSRDYMEVQDNVKELLKVTFQTRNPFTLAVDGTIRAAMETVAANLISPGDTIIVPANAFWGEQIMELIERYGGKAIHLKTKAWISFEQSDIIGALDQYPEAKAVWMVHGESSTGVLQALDLIGPEVRKRNMLMIVDTQATLGCVDLLVDKWEIDVAYAVSSKGLGAPPGLAPITMNERALKVLNEQGTPRTYYYDLALISKQWGIGDDQRTHHSTGLVSNMYALREALIMLHEDEPDFGMAGTIVGLRKSWLKQKIVSETLQAKLVEIDLENYVPMKADRLPSITTVHIPKDISSMMSLEHLDQQERIEISPGIGPTKNVAWRLGLMGKNAKHGMAAALSLGLKRTMRDQRALGLGHTEL